MKNLALFVFLLAPFFSFSQGKLTGRVSDTNGEPMYGVVVRAEEATNIITQTDFDGLFTLNFPDSKSYTVRFYLVGYEELMVPVTVKNNEVISRDFTIEEKGELKEGVEIIARAKKSSDSFMEKKKMNSSLTMDYISADVIKKTGDSNVINAIARVSGVSTNGGLITVRGIGDRYVRTTMNGSRIPTLDPLTNNIQLDIFPATLVDNIVITKTASPELAGDWSGAYISVETKDYPDKLSFSAESTFGYNPQVTFQNFITSARSSSDWLGFDNGLRNRETNDIVSSNLNPSTYQELVALGLGDFYAQQGITGWGDGSNVADTYFRMGLVELGLLAPAQINDAVSYQNALDQYNTIYRPQAIQAITPNGTNYDNGLSNNWDVRYRRAPLNFSQSFSLGNQVDLFGKKFGYVVGFRYGTTYRYDQDGVSQRVGDATLNYPYTRLDHAQMSRETNGWSALMNASYSLNENHKVSFLFMPNFIGVNDVASYRSVRLPEDFQEIELEKNIFYEQRRQLIYQVSSQHYFPDKRLKVDFNTSYTGGQSIAPDFKAVQYIEYVIGDSVQGYLFGPTAGDGIRRFYRYLTENILDSRIDFDWALPQLESKLTRKLKFGAATTRNFRKIDNYEYRVIFGNNVNVPPLLEDDIDTYMSAQRFTVFNGIQDYNYENFDFERNHSFGHSNVEAVYGMVDYEFNPRIRFSGGLRVEHTDIFADVDEFHRLGYARNDPRRINSEGFPFVNPAEINRFDFLPSGNLIFKMVREKYGQTNLRLNYSRSVARPSIRELSDAAIFDNEFRTIVYGNSDLKMVYASNYDVRAETFFNNGDNVSLSVFYKDIRNHIELGFGSSGITWDNIERSSVRGIEIEGKKNITKSLELRANVTLVESRAQFIRKSFQVINGEKNYINVDTLTRPMFGQAPYLINAIASYKADSLGLVFTVSYNIQGPRLVIAGVAEGRPDVYELPRNMVDIKISKTLGKHFSASFTVRDLFNTRISRSYDLPRGWDYFDSFRFGTTYQLGITFKL